MYHIPIFWENLNQSCLLRLKVEDLEADLRVIIIDFIDDN